MVLNEKDYVEIAKRIEKGVNAIEYEKDGETLLIDCTFDVDGYIEDDYFRGTGAWVETERCLTVDKVESYDAEGRDTLTDLDTDRLEKEIA